MTKYAEPNFQAALMNPTDKLRQIDKDLIKELSLFANVLQSILDHGISLTDNVDAVVVSFTSNGVANTEDTIAHTLGKIPVHFIVTSLDKAAVVYQGGTTFTKTNIYLKTSVATTAVKLILL